MTPTQIANFAYWLTEDTSHRGSEKYQGLERLYYIEKTLIPLFLQRYPEGLLSGWRACDALAILRADFAALTSDGFFVECLKLAQTNADTCAAVSMIIAQAKDNRPAVERQIGADLLKKIEDLCSISLF